jgi:hypothetical protein
MDILIYNLEKMNTIPSDFNFTRNLNTIRAEMMNNINDHNELDDSLSQDNSNNENYRNGRWQPCEHYRFIKGCLQYGNNWKKVITFLILNLKGIISFLILLNFKLRD